MGNSAAGGSAMANAGQLTAVNVTAADHGASPADLWSGGGVSLFVHVTLLGHGRRNSVGGPSGQVRFRNTLIQGRCLSGPSYESQGSNIESPFDSCGLGLGDLVSQPTLGLSPVGFNGGPTPTAVPSPSSPAIDFGGACPPPDTDQRGEPRPAATGRGTSVCDSGAVELQPGTTERFIFFDGFERGTSETWSVVVE